MEGNMIQIQTLFLSFSSLFFSKHISTHAHTHTHTHTLMLPSVLNLTNSPPHSSQSSLIPGRGSSPRCLCLNSRDSGIISKVSRHILGPPRRQRRRWKMPPRSLSLHCPYSLIRPSLWLALPPWCVVSAWENAGL